MSPHYAPLIELQPIEFDDVTKGDDHGRSPQCREFDTTGLTSSRLNVSDRKHAVH